MGLGEILIRYLLEAVKFSLGNEIFCKKRQNYAVLLLGAAACVPLWFLLREYVPFFMRFFAYLELLAFVFGSLRCPVRERCAAFLKIYLLMVVCDSLIDIPWELRGMEQSIGWEDALFIDVIQNLIIILLLCLIYIGRECLPTNLRAVLGQFAEKYFFAIGGVVVFAALLLLRGLDIAAAEVADDYTRRTLGFIREGGAVAAGFLGLLFFTIQTANERLQMIRRQQDRYMQKQQEYYELLLEKEQDTRAYRHDMQRHLMNLYALQREEKGVQAQEYLRGLMEGLEEIQKKIYVTGNDVIDVLTSVYLARLDPAVEITFDCQLQPPLKIGDMDLCTIYGNLLENAVEELCREQDPMKDAGQNGGAGQELKDGQASDKQMLRVEITSGRFWFRIHMENSLAEARQEQPDGEKEQTGGSGRKGTWKDDEKNHGLGLENVRRTVEKLDGTYEGRRTEEKYIVTVTMPGGEKMNAEAAGRGGK